MKIFYVNDKRIESNRDIPDVELWYPRIEGNADIIQIGLSDVRAADDIRIRYDFVRDGYVILQASIFEWHADDDVCDMDWQEVAFIRAWGREHNAPDDFAEGTEAKV
jgi:hypothetical protein